MALGKHFLFDVSVCARVSPELINHMMTALVSQLGLTELHRHMFTHPTPQPIPGCSCVVILADSHIAAHSWPEEDAICIDLFTCGTPPNLKILKGVIVDYTGGKPKASVVRRG